MQEGDQPPKVGMAKLKLICHTRLGRHLESYRAAA